VLGRILNVIGKPVDEPSDQIRARRSCRFTGQLRCVVDQNTTVEIFETGIKGTSTCSRRYRKGR